MDDNITPINRTPVNILKGVAKCLSCRHEWNFEGPAGIVWLECPACHLEQGRFKGSVSYQGDHWHCNCGNDLFHVMPDRTYCPCCGITCEFP